MSATKDMQLKNQKCLRHLRLKRCYFLSNPYWSTSYNKARYAATKVACGWAEAVIEKVTWAFWQEQ